MKVEFEIKEKDFVNEKGETIKYKVLTRRLIDGQIIEIPLKQIKDSKLLLMSLALEKYQK